MNSAGINQVFSVPFRHQWSTSFAGEQLAINTRPLGLARFIGDAPNRLLQYLAPENHATGLTDTDSHFQFPIVLYGPSGTGKTSLALTIISDLTENDRALDNSPSIRSSESSTQIDKPVCLTSLDFDRRYRAALETDSLSDFRKRLIQSRGIVIDDLHRWVEKQAAQNEFIQILDEMCRKKRPIVVTMDVSPQLCNGLSAQLVSRLSAGLTLPVNPPGPMAREEIIRDLAKINQIALTDDAIALIVDRLNVTVPKLDHFFSQLRVALESKQKSSSKKNCQDAQSIDAKTLILLFKKSAEDLEQLSSLITQLVSKEFHLKVSELKGNSRKQSIVMARGIAIYLNRVLLGRSFLKIGLGFGNRDHSTIMHAHRKIERMISMQDPSQESISAKTVVEKLKQQLTEKFASQINFI